MSKQLFINTLRCFIYEKDEVGAAVAVEDIIDLIKDYLDPEDGDRVESTQLTAFSSDLEPEELLIVLAHARNGLIKTRIKQCFDFAHQLDELMHSIRHRDDGSGFIPPYNHGDFMDIAKKILTDGEEPT